MLNVICVKVGQKYPSVFVNRLFTMCSRNITQPFKFFCYTDDAEGLVDAVNVIPFVDHGLDIIVHNKLFLFSKELNEYLESGPKLYFDVDMIIKHNIDHIIVPDKNNLTLIRASWREDLPQGRYCRDCFSKIKGYSHHHQLNSSCMIWESAQTQNIWKRFIENVDYHTLAFHHGMDSFLNYESAKSGVNLSFFPERNFWSHEYGVDHYERLNMLRKNPGAGRHAFEKKNWAEIDKIPIVLLNGPNTFHYYEQYKKYYEV
jgi:hypothetical protein